MQPYRMQIDVKWWKLREVEVRREAKVAIDW